YGYQSMATPSSVIDFNMRTKEKTVKKEQKVLGGKFNKENYTEERVWATAADGTKIPISLVYKKGMKKDGTNPLLQYAYGSYGSTMEPYLDRKSTRLNSSHVKISYAVFCLKKKIINTYDALGR